MAKKTRARLYLLDAGLCLGLLVLVGLTFWPVVNFEFVSLDDDTYVTGNAYVLSGLTPSSVSAALWGVEIGHWHPLTFISHMIDVELFGLWAGGHHLVAVIFHGLNTLLLYFILRRMTGNMWASGLAAALFAIHPLHVEPVAWVSSRKDLLSTFFLLLTLWFYVGYSKRGGYYRYALVMLSFGFGLTAKPMLVTLPILLLLLDYWPLDRRTKKNVPWGWLVAEKIPLVALSLLSCGVAFYAVRVAGVLGDSDSFPHWVRVFNAFTTYGLYVSKTIVPIRLTPYYPHPATDLRIIPALVSLLVLAWLTVGAHGLRKQYPYLWVGWLWFLISLLPVIGLIPFGAHRMADRYTYVPLIGLFVAMAWGGRSLAKGAGLHSGPVRVMVSLGLGALALWSMRQVQFWRDSETLYTHTLRVTENNPLIHNNLGAVYAQRGELEKAYEQYRLALEISPQHRIASGNFGGLLLAMGRLDEAQEHLERVVGFRPDDPEVHLNLGSAYLMSGSLDEARQSFLRVLELDGESSKARFNLGAVAFNEGDRDEALKWFREVLVLVPGHRKASEMVQRLTAEE